MCYKCIKTKTCSKTQMYFFKINWSLLHYKIQVHSQGSNTIAIQTTTAFKGIKVLSHCDMISKEIKYYCIMNYIQVN